jgi:MFS family permease
MPILQQRQPGRRLEQVLVVFFILAALSLVAIYSVEPSIYTSMLLLASDASDRYPLKASLFLLVILVFIAVLIFGVVYHWPWLFWLLLIAFSFSILEIPATLLQLAGLFPGRFPLWYSLYRMGVALIERRFKKVDYEQYNGSKNSDRERARNKID